MTCALAYTLHANRDPLILPQTSLYTKQSITFPKIDAPLSLSLFHISQEASSSSDLAFSYFFFPFW